MSSPLAAFRADLASRVVTLIGIDAVRAEDLVRQMRTPDPEHGDLALPCFVLAKALGKNPAVCARDITEGLETDASGPFHRIAAVGPYVNVSIKPVALAEAVVNPARDPAYGTNTSGAGKTVVIDYSSPNIAKPLAFHHIRTTVIGAALARIHQAMGWKVVGIDYLGDWGKQFGLLATGFARHGDPSRRTDAKHLIEVYVKANAEADVAKLRQRMAAKPEAEALVQALRTARKEAEDATNKAKTADKAAKSLEKKLRSLRGLPAESDPLDDLEAWYEKLDREGQLAESQVASAEAFDREARLFFKRMEEGDSEALATWKAFRDTSIEDFERIYLRMGIEFTSIEGESNYTDVLEETVNQVRNAPGTRISDGAEIVDLPCEANEPPILLKTGDGTTLYLTRDLAAAMDRFKRFDFDRSLYVVAADQSLHFRQLFQTLKAMGHPWASRCQHVAFGRIHGMSTRRGNIVFLDEVLDEAEEKAREICIASGKIAEDHIDAVAEAIGIGAVVFGDLRNLRMTDYTFDWADVLNFNGHTGPYVQFSHARASSILRKHAGRLVADSLSLLQLEEERQLMLALARFPETVEQACEDFEPSLLGRNLIDIAQATAAYLTAGNKDREKRVLLDNNDALRGARLCLIDAVRNTLKNGLALLGIRAPEVM
jgi:arginyl-tRNA synthetase